MKLLPSQKAELFDALVSTNFSPSQFSYSDDKNSGFACVVLKSKEHEDFHFDVWELEHYSQYRYGVKYAPAENNYEATIYKPFWPDVLSLFKSWAKNLSREMSVIDKWAQIEHQTSELNPLAPANNEKFTAQEYLLLQQKLQTLKEGIREQQPALGFSEPELSAINQKLDGILQQAMQLGKFDWQNLFIGTIVSIIIQLSVTQENAHLLWSIIKTTFQGVPQLLLF